MPKTGVKPRLETVKDGPFVIGTWDPVLKMICPELMSPEAIQDMLDLRELIGPNGLSSWLAELAGPVVCFGWLGLPRCKTGGRTKG